MDWKWSGFFTILYNALIHAVTLQWDRLPQDGQDLADWWGDLWTRIGSWATSIATAIRNAWYDWIRDIASDAYNAWNRATWLWNKVGSTLRGYAYDIGHYIIVSVQGARNYAVGLYNQAVEYVGTVASSIYATLYPYIDSVVNWVRSLFDWIQPYRELITNWLVGARAVIDWLWHTAWTQLQAFLANPVGWVLGWLLSPITNLVNWWATWGAALHGFVSEDLTRLRNLLAVGFSFLSELTDRPLDTILGLLAPVVIDWLEDRILERW